jgi:hypothetical protein
MNTYDVYFRSDLQWSKRKISAKTAAHALELAHRIADEQFDDLEFESYEGCDCPINEIEVCDEEHNQLVVWHDDDLRLRLAARDLLEAAELVVARWERGDLAEAVRGLDAAIANAKGGAP